MQKMDYERYNEYLKTMPEPVLPSQLPKIKVDWSAMVRYAKERDICIRNLPEEEKQRLLEMFKR